MAIIDFFFPLPAGQGWQQIGELLLAFLLSSLIGLEREFRMKNAGLRTHALVGVGAALFMLISKYSFGNFSGESYVSFDPSRVAAQVVSGIGFIGGGLIFVRGDAVRGLTTAAVVWLTAAVGMASTGGLPFIALLCTALHFAVVYGYTRFTRNMLARQYVVSLTYHPDKDVMHRVFRLLTQQRFTVVDMSTPLPMENEERARATLHITGRQPTNDLFVKLGELDGVHTVGIDQDEE